MKLPLLVLASTALVASVVPALADPGTIGTLIVAGINALAGAGTLSATATIIGSLTVAQAIGATVLMTGLFLLGQQRISIDPGKVKETFTAESGDEIRVIGRARIGGMVAYGNTDGYDRYRLVLHARSITSIVEHWLGGRTVVVEADGAVASPPWARPGGSYCWIETDHGDPDKAAWPSLLAAFPDLWTADHRARGIAQSLIRYVSPGMAAPKYLKLYSGGLPAYEPVVEGEEVYDPRTGGTSYSDNGILAALHLALSMPEFELADFDLVDLAAEADRADALVETLTGTEPRARAWGAWRQSSESRTDVLKALLTSIGAEQVWVGGKLSFRLVDDDPVSEITIPGDIVIDEAVGGAEEVERPNAAVVRYYSPERQYALSEINLDGIAWARVESEIATWGLKEAQIDLRFCPSAAQAQRLARREFALLRADTLVAKTQMGGLAAWGCTVGTIESPTLGGPVKGRLAAPRVDDTGGTVDLSLTVWPDLAPWTPATMEAPAPEVIPEIPVSDAPPQPAAPTAVHAVTYPDGSKELRVGFALATAAIPALGTAAIPEVAVREAATSSQPWLSTTEESAEMPGTGAAWRWAHRSVDVFPASAEARVRVFDGDDGSLWSPTWSGAVATGAASLAAPTLTEEVRDGDVWIVARAPLDLAVAHLTLTGTGAPTGSRPVAPGGKVEWAWSGGVVTWTARAWTSGGATGSPTATYTV